MAIPFLNLYRNNSLNTTRKKKKKVKSLIIIIIIIIIIPLNGAYVDYYYCRFNKEENSSLIECEQSLIVWGKIRKIRKWHAQLLWPKNITSFLLLSPFLFN